MRGGVEQKKEQKKEGLLEAAYQLFLEKGVNKTSVDEIVKKANVAKGTFYLYFKDKHDLMERIIVRKCALILRYVLEELMKKKETCRMSFPEQMLFITEKIIDYLEEHKEIITLIGKNFSSCLSYFNTIEDDRLKSMLSDLVRENLENGFSEHETLKRIYLIVTLVGSVCYDSFVFESPFKISEIKPLLLRSVEKIISEPPTDEKNKSV